MNKYYYKISIEIEPEVLWFLGDNETEALRDAEDVMRHSLMSMGNYQIEFELVDCKIVSGDD